MDRNIQDIIDNRTQTGKEIINPFPGLRPFSIHESHLFFGREGQSEEVLLKLARNRFVSIIGPSGSGKSSFIYCGIIPILYGGFIESSGNGWKVISTRPGKSPVDNLAEALATEELSYQQASEEDKFVKKTLIATLLRTHSQGLVEAISQHESADKNFLLIVDQFEELFRFKKGEDGKDAENEAVAYIELLIEAIQNKNLPIYVVITMRSDFIGECAYFPNLTEKINESYYLLPQMTREQKSLAITGPVAVGGAKIAPRLMQQLLDDLGDNADQLPIMQHALMRTWSYWATVHRDNEPIDVQHYEAIGRMEGALSQHADEAYSELNDKQKRLCETLFKSLTDKGGDVNGIRRPTRLAEIASIADASEEDVIKIIDKFREPGRALLTPHAGVVLHSDSIIDISHESLMRIWLRLKKWVEEEAEGIRMYLRLAEASAKYQVGQAGLWRPPDLQLALNWQLKQKPTLQWAQRYDPAFERVMAFLEFSKKSYETEQRSKEILQKKALRRARAVALILGLFAIISVGFLIFAITQQIRAKEQAEIARKNEQKAKVQTRLALISERNAKNQRIFAEQQRAKAKEQEQLARESEQIAQQERLKAELSEQEALKQQKIAQEERVRAEDNERVAKEQTSIAIKEKNNAYQSRLLSIAQAMAVKSLQVIDMDLKLLTSGQAYAFNAQYGGKEDDPYIYEGLYYAVKKSKDESFNNLKGHSDNVRSLISANTGNYVYSAGSDGKILRWDIENPEKTYTSLDQEKNSIVRTLALSRDNKWLAGGGEFSFIKIYNLSRLDNPPQKIKIPSRLIWFLSYTQADQGLVFSDSSSVYHYDFKAFNQLYRATSKINTIAVSPVHNTVALGNQAGQVIMLNLDKNGAESMLFQNKEPITAISFSQDGQLLAVGDTKGIVKVWDVKKQELISTLVGHSARINNVSFSWDDKKLATGSWDKTVRLWNTSKWANLPIVLKDHPDWVWSVAFSADNDKLLAGCRDSFVRIWPTNAKTLADMICGKTKRNMSKKEWEQFVAEVTDVPYEKTCPVLPAGEGIINQ
ncbi:High-affnity carbon uptake protein Hat/HatR [Rhodocytophaga rosea]|uniref:High-affnity carbon uptake protein Hat/HatR n=1 Tax=Rhodocytophaga rosea TaxID=2704465 RepID=A0A6C0GMR0_9BACT|nr:High-affnity carbon uptake protein Hat/HatR [Rhodocytophaga rosea]QHT68892.1 High-affnity carbon uptake protein Hat/HatR [Rhodocytophaga rosea]